MPRRSGGFSRSSAPARSTLPATRPAAPPAHAPPPAPQAGGGGPGLFGQMAATAGGVAIGSAVGHTIGHAMTSGGGGGGEAAQAEAAPTQYQHAPQAQQSPCAEQLQQFLECSQNQRDLSMCEGFSFALKECRQRYELKSVKRDIAPCHCYAFYFRTGTSYCVFQPKASPFLLSFSIP